jgi:rhodanese-related sulfurtransferase
MLRRLFGGNGPTVPQMSVATLRAHLDARQPLQLLDVRSPEEFQGDGHIADARLIPLPMLALRLNEIRRDVPIVVICRSGNRSQAAADLLLAHGFSEVSNVQGGMLAWQRAGYPAH